MKPKEALATLIYGLTNNQYAKEDLGVTMSKCEEIIQNAFTRLEKLEEAIDIVKRKMVSVVSLIASNDCDYYNEHVSEFRKLTQDEFELLKEVFGNDR